MRRILLAALWLWSVCGSGAMARSRCYVMAARIVPNLRIGSRRQLLIGEVFGAMPEFDEPSREHGG